MGMPPFGNRYSDSNCASVCAASKKEACERLPNPDPQRFTWVSLQAFGRYVLAEINYTGCTNFEGNKLLLFYDVPLATLRDLKVIDPHFAESGVAPIARFAPTAEGRAMAHACLFQEGKPVARLERCLLNEAQQHDKTRQRLEARERELERMRSNLYRDRVAQKEKR